jgi:hypothetical protein
MSEDILIIIGQDMAMLARGVPYLSDDGTMVIFLTKLNKQDSMHYMH